jgi:hypothetical protein
LTPLVVASLLSWDDIQLDPTRNSIVEAAKMISDDTNGYFRVEIFFLFITLLGVYASIQVAKLLRKK